MHKCSVVLETIEHSIGNKAEEHKGSKISVICCTKNSEATIENTIKTIKSSSYNLDSIIIVDGFSNDNTVEIAKHAGVTTVITQPIKKFTGKGIAMNAGI